MGRLLRRLVTVRGEIQAQGYEPALFGRPDSNNSGEVVEVVDFDFDALFKPMQSGRRAWEEVDFDALFAFVESGEQVFVRGSASDIKILELSIPEDRYIGLLEEGGFSPPNFEL